MLLASLKNVLDAAIAAYIKRNGSTRDAVCTAMGGHLEEMAKQHREDDPQIPYEDPLCRLAYLYMHVGATATLASRAFKKLSIPHNVIKARNGKTLRVCAMGGGPGSEMLGLAKYLAEWPLGGIPSRIDFVVLDKVPQWGETWTQLAHEAEVALAGAVAGWGGSPPVIAPMFHPIDVTDPASYKTYAWLFSNVDLVICNYLISENLDRLNELTDALASVVAEASPDAAFVFIDRKEYSDRINDWLVGILAGVGLTSIEGPVFEDGRLDSQDQVDPDLADYPEKIGKHPRVKFFNAGSRSATAFYLAAKKAAPQP